jgi:hypothetical protein
MNLFRFLKINRTKRRRRKNSTEMHHKKKNKHMTRKYRGSKIRGG